MENELQPVLSHAEPVLSVQDVVATVEYWHHTLGFPLKWTWGDPPNHGGVSWNEAFIQFSFNPELAAASKGNSVWIRVQRLKSLYGLHQKNKAEIVSPLESKPWGLSEYTIREINGYYIHFSSPITDREKSAEAFPRTVRIIARKPTVKEYRSLISSVGWSASADDAIIEMVLKAPLFAVVAEDITSNETIGCALLLGDNASFYYVKDVMVSKAWQGKRIGTALMQALTHWMETNAPDCATAGLITGDNLAKFYQQFGFTQVFGMMREIRRIEKGE